MKANRPYFLQIAVRNLKHGGQRVLLSILCVIFGAMSFVGMNTVANTLRPALLLESNEVLGGDFGIYTNNDASFTEAHRQELDKLKDSGEIQGYTMLASTKHLVYKTQDNPVWHYAGNGLGIDTKSYPLAGNFSVSDKKVTQVTSLLEDENTVLVTMDIAENFNIKTGDELIISDLSVGVPLTVTVKGILNDTPNHEGDKIYYSHETARKLGNGALHIGSTMVNAEEIENLGFFSKSDDFWLWSARGLSELRADRDSTLRLALNAAGGLGLLVGGIGVANTMIVLISRRRKQIATWKLLGYENKHIRAIFLIEALLMGIIGALIGAGLGILLSKVLTKMFLRTTTWLVIWKPDYISAAIGIATGVITTLLFSLWAILRASDVSPASVLRAEEKGADKVALLKSIGLLLLVGIPFLLMTTYIMGSVAKGSMVLGGTIGVFVLVCLFIAAGIWLLTALLPTKRMPQLFLAKQHLRRDGITPIMAGAALFVGVITILYSAIAVESSRNYKQSTGYWWPGPNAVIMAPYDQEASIRDAVKALEPIEAQMGYKTTLKSVQPDNDVNYVIFGREDPTHFIHLNGVQKDSFTSAHGAFINDPRSFMSPENIAQYNQMLAEQDKELNNELNIEFYDGTKATVPIEGSYSPSFSYPANLDYFRPIYMHSDALKALTEPEQMQYFLKLSPEMLAAMPQKLKGIDQQAVVINIPEWINRGNQRYQNFYILGIAMAALAFSAGFVLIANSVSLSILNRRDEIGVLKCVGYSRGKIIGSLVLEYLIVGLTAFVAGLGVSEALLFLIRQTSDTAMNLLKLPASAIGISALISIGITVLSVIVIAWKPVQVTPTVVLADRE